MSCSILKEFSFGENNGYFYKFNIHIYQVPGSNNRISTIMVLSTNMMYLSKDLVDPYLPDMILFLANLVVEYQASFDAYHNQLDPYSYDESEDIAEQVNAKALEIRQSMANQ